MHCERGVGTVDDGRGERQSAGASIAVVGGGGFIGRRLSAALVSIGYGVRVVDVVGPQGAHGSYRCADVRDRGAVATALAGTDVVYSLAAVHQDDARPVALYDEVNVAGADSICGVCRELDIDRIVFTSSVAVYGSATRDASEEQVPAPFNAYGRSKLRAEQVYREWQAEAPERRSLVIVRPTVVFGEGNRGNLHQLVRQIMARRFVMVGDGRNRKSMAYVDNVSAFLVHVLSLGVGTHLFNYVDGPDLSMEELVQTISLALGRTSAARARIPYLVGYLGGLVCDAVAAVMGKKFSISAVRIKKFCSSTTFAADRLRATGFCPQIGLREALLKTIEYEVRECGKSGAAMADGPRT